MKQHVRVSALIATVALAVACSGGGGKSTVPSTTAAGRTPAGTHHAFALPKHAAQKRAQDANGNLADGGYESGGTTYWQQCGSVNASVTSARAHSGTYSELNGQVSTPEVNGYAGLCQQVTVPTSGKISFWLYEGTNEKSTTYAYQEADLLDSSGNVLDNLFTEAVTTSGWVQRTYDVSSYAGQTVWLYFGVYGDGYSSGYIYQYVDDVAWSNGATPTPQPTATPTVKPTATPTNGPTPTPTAKPTPTPTPVQTPTPSGGPTPFPTPAGSGPNGTSCGISCGVQRWHIKTLDDPDEHLINWNPVLASVTTLRNIPVPSNYQQYNDSSRYAPTETQVYTVRAILVGWKTETDNDFHIVIADPNNPSNTMIVEPPDSACSMACDSGFGPDFDAVRAKLTKCFGQPNSTFKNFSQTIVADFTGVPLFDALHGQTGVAPNGIELHPLLDVNFVSGTSGC